MNRFARLSAFFAVSLLACSERSPGPTADAGAAPVQARPEVVDAGAPEPVVEAAPADAGALAEAPDAGSGACSASRLSAKTQIPMPPPPPPVERMRRRIIAAAVACDDAALEKLADENGKGLTYTFGDGESPTAYWREHEKEGQPVLARMVQLLNLPYAREDEKFVWPAVHVTVTEKNWQALSGVYPEEQLREMKKEGGYLGLRLAISAKGDWLFAVAGD